jgi:hypothetical protein
MTNSVIRLEAIHRGNPFADHPQLRTIFDAERSRHVEADTLADLALGVTRDPHRNRVYLARDDTENVVGIMGFPAHGGADDGQGDDCAAVARRGSSIPWTRLLGRDVRPGLPAGPPFHARSTVIR